MTPATQQTYLRIAALGALAGIRSMSAPALLSIYLSAQEPSPADTPPGLLNGPPITQLFQLMTLGEMVADKLPFLPDRVALLPRLGRMLSGGLAGAALAAANHIHPLVGALIGGAAALAATYASYYLRRLLGERLHVPDPLVGMLEDGLVVGGGMRLAQKL